MIRTIVRKLFVTGNYFTIAIRKRDGSVLDQMRFSAAYTVPATREEWCADPFLAEDHGHAYLFYEKVHGDHGSIEVAEILDDCRLSEPAVLFSGDTHWSYPNVFCVDDQWYMIPESSAKKEVSLYSAEAFPYKWKKENVLLKEAAVDTTVFSLNGQWYLLTFLPEQGTERVRPLAFAVRDGKCEPLIWEDYDPLRVRGAGSPFWYHDAMVRPVQVSTEKRYGDAIAFVKMEVQGNRYHETEISAFEAELVRAKGQFYDGLHTYNSTDEYEVIDIRCGKLSPVKPVQRLLSKAFGRFKK